MEAFIPKESYWGNIEYKKKFVNMTAEKIKKYATQLKFRIIEGSGTAIYIIGVLDNGKVVGIKKSEIAKGNLIMENICSEINAYIYSCKTIDISQYNKLLIYVLKNNFNINNIPYLTG